MNEPVKTQTRIMIVDDDPDLAMAMRLPLETHGFRVSVARSGEEMLSTIAAVEPDLVLLDVMMEHDTAGFQALYKLRNPPMGADFAPWARVPVLMLTAIGTEKGFQFSPEADGAFLPADGFLQKPVRAEALIEVIESTLHAAERA